MSSLLRSTKFVRYFTGAARALILNSTKTAETNYLINPKALCATNNVLLRDYTTSKKTESLDPLLQKIDTEVRKFGRITKRDIDEVFDEIRIRNNITSSQSLLVIKCCGELVPEELPEQRTLLVQKIWSLLTERGIPMDISHYNALLKVYIENEHPFSPAKFLEELEKKGLQANRVTYQRLMWRYCQEGDVDGATKVLEKMRELNMPVSEPVLNALVMGHAFHGDTEGAKAVLETMAGAGLEPSNRTYALLACGYAKKGDIDGVENVIKTSTEKDAYMTDKDLLDIIEHLSIGGHGDKVEQLFSHLHKPPGYNQDVCNLILRLLNKGHEDTAMKVMKTMPRSEHEDRKLFRGGFFIKQILRLKKSPEEILKMCRELQNEDLVPHAFYIATETALQNGQVELAQHLFKEMQKDGLELRQHYYWPLLVQKGKEKDEEGLLQILRNMAKEGLTPSGETLRDYVIPYLSEKDTPQNVILKLQIANVSVIHGARNVMMELLESGKIKEAANIALQYQPRGQYSLISRPLTNALAKTKDINSFVKILHVISFNPQLQHEEESIKDEIANQTEEKTDSAEIGRIVKSAVNILSNPVEIQKLLKAVYSKGLRINTASAEAIQQYLGEKMTSDISELLTNLTSNDLEPVAIATPRKTLVPTSSAQLEHLLSQAKTKGANNTNRLQKQLLNAYIKENNLEKVDNYLKELETSNFELSIPTLAQLFEFYCCNDNIEKANEYKAKLYEKDPDFVLNNIKLFHMGFALVRANKFDEAVQFLKNNTPRGDIERGFVYNSKCWQMLNTLAEQRDPAKVKEMTEVLIQNNYIEVSNVILGPSIKVHLLNEDLESALKAYEDACKQYRSTPWKGQLMKSLIMKEEATKLQWLADISTQIHGEVNILHDLVLAFVECGRLRQARRILETPGLQTRHARLDDACQRYVEEGKSEYLEGLLEATKELSHIDRSNIFYHLLVTYCKANDTDKALGLWTVLQEDGEVPSDEFLSYLGKHLKENNRHVPFIIPEENTVKKTDKEMLQKIVTPKVKESGKPTKKEVITKIEDFIKEGKTSQAVDFVIKVINEGVMPKSNVLKFLLKNLAEEGNVEKIQYLGNYFDEKVKRLVTYDDKLTLAVFIAGSEIKHVNDLLESVQTAKNDDDLNVALRKFPKSNALASIIQNDEIVKKCQKIAEIAAEKGNILPANLLWMELLIAGKHNEADTIWKQTLINANNIMFRRLLQEAFVNNQPQSIVKLITTLETNKNITKTSIGNAYSRLINTYLEANNLNEAKAAFEKAIQNGITEDHIHNNTLKRLKTNLEDAGLQLN